MHDQTHGRMPCAMPYVTGVRAVGFYHYESISIYSTSVEQMCNNVLLFITFQPMEASVLLLLLVVVVIVVLVAVATITTAVSTSAVVIWQWCDGVV